MKLNEKTYSDWKLEDVCNEYKNKYGGLLKFFEVWRKYNFRIKYHLKINEVKEEIQNVFDNLTLDKVWYIHAKENKDYLEIINILYEVGFIGDFILGGDGGSKTIYSTIDDTHEPTFNEIQIHPCFRPAVGTVTRIR